MSDGIDQGNDEFQWPLVVSLLVAWIVIFLCLCKGIKSSGKVNIINSQLNRIPNVKLVLFIGFCKMCKPLRKISKMACIYTHDGFPYDTGGLRHSDFPLYRSYNLADQKCDP